LKNEDLVGSNNYKQPKALQDKQLANGILKKFPIDDNIDMRQFMAIGPWDRTYLVVDPWTME
jgi:hypothetical protein